MDLVPVREPSLKGFWVLVVCQDGRGELRLSRGGGDDDAYDEENTLCCKELGLRWPKTLTNELTASICASSVCMRLCVLGNKAVSVTPLKRIISIHYTIWKLLPLDWVEWKPILWHCDTAAVFLWQETGFVVPAERLIKMVRRRTEARGLCHSFPATMQVSNSAEGVGGDFPLGRGGLDFD